MWRVNIRKEFDSDAQKLHNAIPLVGATESWLNLDDVPNAEKAIMLYFKELKDKKLYAVIERKDDVSYAKLYITDARRKNICKVYVRSSALNFFG